MNHLRDTFIILFSLLALELSAQSSYQMFVDLEGGSSGTQITTAILDASTYTNSFTGTWTISPATHTAFAITNQQDAALRGSILLGSTLYTGSGHNRTAQVQVSGSTSRECQYSFGAPFYTGQIAVGWYWRFGTTLSLGDFVDVFHVDSISGDFAVAAFRDDAAPDKSIRIHTNVGVGPDVDVSPNTTYWLTILYNTNNGAQGTAKLAVFDATTWLCLGISSLAFSTRGMAEYLKFGHCNGHTATDTFPMWYDDILVETGPTSVSNWPLLPAGGTISAASASRANFDWAYTNAQSSVGTNKDTIAMPTSSDTWTSGYTISKNGLIIKGNGTNNTVITADGVFDCLTVSGTLNTVTNFQLKGDGANDEATGIVNSGAYNIYRNLYLRELDIAFYAQNSGVLDNCVLADNRYMARNIFGNSYFNTYFPLAWDSTNFFVYEDNRFYWTSAKNAGGSGILMSSQEGQAFVIRHNYFEFNKASIDIQPGFDYHGDWDPGSDPANRPGTGLQIYSNYFNDVIGTTISGSKFVDVRGGRSLIYSNRWVGSSFSSGDGIVYREEHPEDSSPYLVNNSYVWQNKHGIAGTTAMPINDDVNLTDGVDYFSSALDPLVQIPYPHPQRGETPAAQTPTVASRVGVGRARVRALTP